MSFTFLLRQMSKVSEVAPILHTITFDRLNVIAALKITASRSMVIDRRNKTCDCQKVLLNGHHDCQYLDVTTFTNFLFYTFFLKQYFPYFEIAKQIYNKNIAYVIRNMEINSNTMTSSNLQITVLTS